MDFDHVRGEKSFVLSLAHTRSWPEIHAELAKCEIVCANCHRIRTLERKDYRPKDYREPPKTTLQLTLTFEED